MIMDKNIQIDVSVMTILKIVMIILAFWLLYLVREIAVMFVFALILVAALTPLVDKMAKYIPRTLAVSILTLFFIAILVGIGFLMVPVLITEIKQLAINLPIISSKWGPVYESIKHSMGTYQESNLNFSSEISKLTSGIYSKTMGFISGIIAFVTVIVLSFYMLVGKDSTNSLFYNLFPESKRDKIAAITQKISDKMGQWLGGHLFLMLVIGLCDSLALTILGIPYALILAIWGGLTEIIPYLGPWLGAIPAVLIALTVSPLAALFVAIAFLIIQQLESHFLAPKIIGEAVGLSPVIIILALLIGAKLMGLIGVLISVPIAAAISVLVTEWPEIRELVK